MRAAGVERIGAAIRPLELPDPGPPRAGEVLLEVRASGMGNWDEFIRTGGWDTGARPPMPLGVEAAGLVASVGAGVRDFGPGDAVTTHSLPAGSWAELFIAAADHVALIPAGMPMTVAAALPVPALTADQALDTLAVRPGETVLVHGAGGVTGAVLVRLAAHQVMNSPVPKRPGSSPGPAPKGQRTLVTPRSRTAASTSVRNPPGGRSSKTPP